jgi:hypothetical protein
MGFGKASRARVSDSFIGQRNRDCCHEKHRTGEMQQRLTLVTPTSDRRGDGPGDSGQCADRSTRPGFQAARQAS